jgi:hypothetical protein
MPFDWFSWMNSLHRLPIALGFTAQIVLVPLGFLTPNNVFVYFHAAVITQNPIPRAAVFPFGW